MAIASVKLNASASGYKNEIKSAAAVTKELTSEYNLAAAQAKLFGKASDELKARVEMLTKKVDVQKGVVKTNSDEQERLAERLEKQKTRHEQLTAKIKDAERAYEAEKEATGKNSEETKKLKAELDKLNDELAQNEKNIKNSEVALTNQKAKTNDAKAKLAELEKELKDVNKELKEHGLDEFAKGCEKVGSKIQDVGKKLTVISTAITGFATGAVKTASDFDTSMSRVQAISGATTDDMVTLRDKAREMGEKTKFSAMEAGDAMYYMAMAGWDTEDMLNSVEGIMNLAAASGEDLALTSDIVTDAMTAFGLSADGTTQIVRDGLIEEVSNATHFADVLAAASSNANTNVALLGESFKYVAPVAGSLGYSVEDTAIALGLMANAGIKASSGGTALRSMLTNLAKPTDEVESAMEYLGISLQNNDGSMKTLMEVMQDLRSSFGECKMPVEEFQNQLAEVEAQYESGELTEKQYSEAVEDLTEKAYGAEGALKAKYAATLAGKTGMSGLLAIVGSSDKDFEKLTNAIYQSDGAAQEMADIMQDNLAGQVTILKSKMQEFGISIGEQLVPFVKDGVSVLQDIMDKFNSMSDSQKQAIIKIGGVVAAIGPLLVVGGSLVKGVKSVIDVGKSVGSVVGGVGKVLGACSPTVLIVVGVIALLIAAGVALYQNWDTIKEWAGKLWEGIKETFNGIKDAISNAFNAAKEAVSNKVKEIQDGVSNGFNEAKKAVSDKLNEMKDAVLENPIVQVAGQVFGAVGGVVDSVMTAAVDTAKEKLGNMKTAYEENGGGIQGIVAAGWEGIKGFHEAGFTFVDNLTGGKLTELQSKFSEKINAVKEDWKSKFANIKDTATNMMETAKNNVSAKLDNMKAAYNEKGGGIRGVANVVFTGVKDIIGSAMDRANTLTGGKLDSIRSAFSSKLEAAHSTVSSVMDGIRNAFTSKMDLAKSAVSGAIDKIKGFFNFSWSLPKLKMPHPKISGKFSLNPPQVPSFSIDWYKTGGIMNSPTIFGMNGSTFLAGGEPETGGEAILPLAPFYTRLNAILDKRLEAVERMQTIYVENHTYIDGEEISSRTVTKVDEKRERDYRKRR